MKRSLIPAILLGLLFTTACLKKQKQETTPGTVEHQDYNIEFLGYKSTAKVNASPEEVGKYLQDPANLLQSGSAISLQPVAGGRFEKRGDEAVYKGEAAGMPLEVRVWLWTIDPGKELFFVCLFNENAMAYLRFQMRKLYDGARLESTFELEESNPLLPEMIETSKLNGPVRRMQDESIARMQMHFDPSLKMEDLVSDTPRGEAINKFYETNNTSVWVDAPVSRVAEYVASPEFTESTKNKYKLDFRMALQDKKPGLYKISADWLGVKVDPDLLVMSYQPEKHFLAYMHGNIQSRIVLTLVPEKGGTRASFAFVLDAPSNLSSEIAKTLTNTVQLPKYIGMALLDAKAELEKDK